jgi:hypothetical protein
VTSPREEPFRDGDPAARIEALRTERGNLARSLAILLADARAADARPWRWTRFAVGLSIPPALALLLFALLRCLLPSGFR